MFYLQFMVAFPSGQPGDPAVSPVEKASKRGVVCATTPLQPMVGSLARDRIRKCGTVTLSCVQVNLYSPDGHVFSRYSFLFPNYGLSHY